MIDVTLRVHFSSECVDRANLHNADDSNLVHYTHTEHDDFYKLHATEEGLCCKRKDQSEIRVPWKDVGRVEVIHQITIPAKDQITDIIDVTKITADIDKVIAKVTQLGAAMKEVAKDPFFNLMGKVLQEAERITPKA